MQTFKPDEVNNYKILYTDNLKFYRHLNKIFDKLATHRIQHYTLEVFGFNVKNQKVSYLVEHNVGLPHPLDINVNIFENTLAVLKEHGAKELNVNLFFKKPEEADFDTIQIEE